MTNTPTSDESSSRSAARPAVPRPRSFGPRVGPPLPHPTKIGPVLDRAFLVVSVPLLSGRCSSAPPFVFGSWGKIPLSIYLNCPARSGSPTGCLRPSAGVAVCDRRIRWLGATHRPLPAVPLKPLPGTVGPSTLNTSGWLRSAPPCAPCPGYSGPCLPRRHAPMVARCWIRQGSGGLVPPIGPGSGCEPPDGIKTPSYYRGRIGLVPHDQRDIVGGSDYARLERGL